VAGRTYLEGGRPVLVLLTSRRRRLPNPPGVATRPLAPLNVLVQRADGSCTVRPFRGLRRACRAAQARARLDRIARSCVSAGSCWSRWYSCEPTACMVIRPSAS